MLLSELLRDVCEVKKDADKEIDFVTCKSDQVKENSLFVCIAGLKKDGHDFAKEAIRKGAVAIVCEKTLGIKNEIVVENSRNAYTLISSNFYANPAKKMKLIGVTGTNGKTSVATVIKRILCNNRIKSGLISTIQAEYAEIIRETENTTPEPMALNMILNEMYKAGMEVVSMEASSHSLIQKRLYGLEYDIGIFTNLSQDHLDYHKDMEEYYKAKKMLFDICKCGIINIDDEYGLRLYKEISCRKVSYSIKDDTADYYADGIVNDESGVRFLLKHNDVSTAIFFSTPGIFSVQNALASAAVCIELGLSAQKTAKGISNCDNVRGRYEMIRAGQPFNVICDYAHTPDGLKNLLKSVRDCTKGKITVLFGCGGDRDKSKRQVMGKVASEFADFLIVTSDNPRTENPKAIINDILGGVPSEKPHICFLSRTEALRYAILNSEKGSTLVIAGKGHEDYQILGDKKVLFDERKIVYGILRAYKNTRRR